MPERRRLPNGQLDPRPVSDTGETLKGPVDDLVAGMEQMFDPLLHPKSLPDVMGYMMPSFGTVPTGLLRAVAPRNIAPALKSGAAVTRPSAWEGMTEAAKAAYKDEMVRKYLEKFGRGGQ